MEGVSAGCLHPAWSDKRVVVVEAYTQYIMRVARGYVVAKGQRSIAPRWLDKDRGKHHWLCRYRGLP